MDSLLKNLRSFFIHVHAFPMKWQLELRKAEEYVTALSNQAEQLRYVNAVPEDDKEIELMQLRDFKFLLLAKIHAGAEEELESAQKVLHECAEMVLEMKGRLSNLEQAVSAIDWAKEEQLTLKGSATLPPVLQLLEWAEDFWRFYHVQYLQFSCALTALQLEEESSVEALQAAVKPKAELPSSLQWALALTLPLLAEAPTSAAALALAPSPARSPHTPAPARVREHL
ncbi:hypothetical protein R5R35_005650 [Gryllus longicercus]|uniref:Uncharacterized protein n=1 Tax=Gryllus longicercus TaxID=2509291 RepID=A0AAN9VR59_9ORTH